MKQMNWLVNAGLALALPLAMPLPLNAADERGVGDVVYVPTPQIVVDEMLGMAKIGPKDFIIDLGSGDGRMVITAARKFGARGFGVDLSDDLLAEANRNSKREGVAERAQFFKQNLFETDLSKATVISSYLLPEMNEKLRPKILNLKPGTRVVAHDYHMGDWEADDERTLSVPEKVVGTPGVSYTYLWIVPAKVAGHWQSQRAAGAQTVDWDFDFTQKYQKFEGIARSGGQRVKLPVSRLEADKLSLVFFTKPGNPATRHEFKGTVNGSVIDGTLTLGEGSGQKTLPWSAKFAPRPAGGK